MLKNEYPDFLGTDDARLVAEHTFDTSEYLMARHKEEPLDTDFSAGETYETITWQAACHYRAQQIGPKSRDLMALTGRQGDDASSAARRSTARGDCGPRTSRWRARSPSR